MVFLQYFVDAVFGELNSKGGSMPDYQSGEGVLSLSSSGAVADHGIREARHRQALIRLSSAIMEMPVFSQQRLQHPPPPASRSPPSRLPPPTPH